MRRLAVVLVVALLATAVLVLGPVAQAHMKAHCDQSHVAQIDPIVARGAAVSDHLHAFYATSIQDTPDSTRVDWDALQGVTTNCAVQGDHAAYWTPTLLRNGSVLDAYRMIGYYGCFQSARVDECGTGPQIEGFPHDMRLVAGDPNAVGPQSLNVVSWVCTGVNDPNSPYASVSEADCETRFPNNTGIAVRVDFPSCWDGTLADHTVDGNTADADGPGPQTDRVVYPDGYPSKYATCPDTHPRQLSHLRLNIGWRCDAEKSWACESDEFTLSSGSQYTMHADFLNGWTDAGMADLLSCVNTGSGHPHGSSVRCGK